MVKYKKKLPNNNSSYEYQIKTRNRDKKINSMSREVKNLQGNDWFQKNNSSNSKIKNTNLKQSNIKIKIKLLKQIKKDDKKSNQNIINKTPELNSIILKDNKKGKHANQKKETKKVHTEINKYIFQWNEYFDLKEVLTFINDKLNINIDSQNNKIKDKDEFKIKMNDILKKLFVIYFNKILITEQNLKIFLEFLSEYIKLEVNEIIQYLNMKNNKQRIEENIELEQYFKPRLVLVEK